MDKKSKLKALLEEKLREQAAILPPKYYAIVVSFLEEYRKSVPSFEETIPTLLLYLDLVAKQFPTPFSFASYHQKIRAPIDYYQFGLDFISPLIERSTSSLQGEAVVEQIERWMDQKENVILLANHQVEADPQALSLLLEKDHPQLASSIIYVAGERVVTDPLAIPFSMGCDLLCIYSKRYIDNPLEEKREKQIHNQKTMELMASLLREGGKTIYVAPSGGRDRPNKKGIVEVAPFDPDSLEMFYLMAKKGKTPTHFIPLSLCTHAILPPPETIQVELGETRRTKRAPVHLHFGEEFSMDHFPGSEKPDKLQRRQARALALWNIVHHNYLQFPA